MLLGIRVLRPFFFGMAYGIHLSDMEHVNEPLLQERRSECERGGRNDLERGGHALAMRTHVAIIAGISEHHTVATAVVPLRAELIIIQPENLTVDEWVTTLLSRYDLIVLIRLYCEPPPPGSA